MKRFLKVSGNFLGCCLVLLWEGPGNHGELYTRTGCESSEMRDKCHLPTNTFVNVKNGSHNSYVALC